jgi:hypothetical protein
MKVWPYILTAIVFFFLGAWGACSIMIKPVAQVECIQDTVFVPGETIVVDKPKAISVRPAKSLTSTIWTPDHLPDARKSISPCDSIRTYEYSDSALIVRDSVQGILLQKTIIRKPAVRPILIQKKDSLIYVNQRGLYLGGSAGLNSIRAEVEYIDKKGWSYTAGYDLINKSPVLGIRRRIW